MIHNTTGDVLDNPEYAIIKLKPGDVVLTKNNTYLLVTKVLDNMIFSYKPLKSDFTIDLTTEYGLKGSRMFKRGDFLHYRARDVQLIVSPDKIPEYIRTLYYDL